MNINNMWHHFVLLTVVARVWWDLKGTISERSLGWLCLHHTRGWSLRPWASSEPAEGKFWPFLEPLWLLLVEELLPERRKRQLGTAFSPVFVSQIMGKISCHLECRVSNSYTEVHNLNLFYWHLVKKTNFTRNQVIKLSALQETLYHWKDWLSYKVPFSN